MKHRSPADDGPHPWGEVLGTGVIAGVLAGFVAGAIDAIGSWGAAAQFVPGLGAHLRFVLFIGLIHALAGAVFGLVVTAGLLLLSRLTRIGDLLRFGHREHLARRARDPGAAVTGLALVLVGIPCIAAALWAAFRITVPNLTGRHGIGTLSELKTNVLVSVGATFAALIIAVPIAFLLGRLLEWLLGAIARKWPPVGRVLSWPYAPVVAAIVVVATVVSVLVAFEWENARFIPFHGPLVVIAGCLLAVVMWRPARSVVVLLTVMLPRLRYAFIVGAPVVLCALVLATGGSVAVTKASSSHTGLGGPITRGLRKAFDRDRDGFARYLGGGDCDDGDRTIYPGAPEIPNDGIDQNCVGGDVKVKRSVDEVGFVPVPASIPKDFSVLMITIDTLRADHLGAYGYKRPTTPNLDKLAAEGVVFEHGWAHAPSTRYSIPAILTGRFPLDVYYNPATQNVTNPGWPGILDVATTVAEVLGSRIPDLRSKAITNYWYFEKGRKFDQGFKEYDNENQKLHGSVAGAGFEQTRGSSSKEQTDKAMSFVEHNASQRFMLWVHYYDPHYAYEMHPDVPQFGTDTLARYDNEIAFTDKHIGRLLEDLRTRGLYDKTIIVVTGDHGEGFGEHNVADSKRHGYHLYAAQTKVPFIIRVPGLPPRRSTTPAGHVDILATLANLVGAAPTTEMSGRSLVSALTGTDHDRVVYQQLSYEGNNEMRAGVSRTCHVIYNVSPDPSWEVYRIDRDPDETVDLAGSDECAATRDEVAQRYDTEQVPAGADDALLKSRPAITKPLDADFGAGVRLLALDAPATVKQGETVTLTWTFEARGIVAPGWKQFVHLKGPANAFFQGDHRPTRPFEWWRAGQFIRYTSTITVPTNARVGEYKLETGMFDRKNVRAPVRAPRGVTVDNNALVLKIVVTQ